MTLLDSCIIIDLLRGRQAALDYIEGLHGRPCISVVTAMEIVAGMRSGKERRQFGNMLAIYAVFDVTLDVAHSAGDYLRQYAPSHGIDPIDALIAATAKRHDLPLATLNLKHFPMFEGLERPYQP